jgi:hypothetical protein
MEVVGNTVASCNIAEISPFYGTTKKGKFMTVDDAKKAGYKAAKEPVAKKAKADAKQ